MRRQLRAPTVLLLGGLAWAAAHWAAHRVAGGSAGAPSQHGSELHGSRAPEAFDLGYLSTSLALCLSLSLVLAARAALDSRGRSRHGRSLWLFAAVPVLGLLGEVLLAPGWTVAGGGSTLIALALIVLAVQVMVALVAPRVAQGILGLAELVARAVAAPSFGLHAQAGAVAFPPIRSDRAPAGRLVLGGGQRAPPSPRPAW